jgi:putative inorganic carbon (HCO3(-)) transporter
VRIVLYVGLVIAVIDTPVRLRWFLASCALCAAIVTGLAILNYQGIVTISGYHIVEADVRRLGACGLYGDPNDLALLITQGLILAAYGLTNRRWSMPIRLVHLAWIAVLGLGLQLTYSRGGLLALLAGVATAVLTRYRAKGLMIAGLTLPLVLTVFAGRQADFSGAIGSGSGQSRIHLWDHYLSLVADNPGLGVGAGGWKYHARQVAHNSFLHAFAETGLPGGVAFLALFVLAAQTLSGLGSRSRQILDPEMARLRPYLLAMLSSYVVGMLSLTRVFTLPTYTMLACIAAYARLTPAEPPCQPPRLNPTFWCKATAAGFLFLVLTWIYVKRSASYY